MPRIITDSASTLGRAAGQAAATLYAERARQDQLDREAQQLALAERRLDNQDRAFERGIFESDRAFDFNTGQAAAENARADQRMEIAQKNAERQGAIFERAVGQEDASNAFFMQILDADPDRTPEELAYLREASPDVIRSAANTSELKRQTREGRMRLGSLAGTVAQTMQLQEGDPRLAIMQQIVSGAGDSLEAQAQARSFLTEQLNGFMAQQAEIQQRAAMAESFKPFAEGLMQTLPPSSAGLVGTSYQLWANGNLDDDEFLGQLQDAVKNARSGTTNRTVGEELLTSAARSFGTQLGQGNLIDTEVREGIKTARDIATSLDGSATRPAESSVGRSAPQTSSESPQVVNRINSYDGLVSDARGRIADLPTESMKVRETAAFVQKVFDKQGISGDDAAVLAKQMMMDILAEGDS